MLHSETLNNVKGKKQRKGQHLFEKWIEEDDGLDGLSQPHLVRQDGVSALSPGKPKPVQALQLVQM